MSGEDSDRSSRHQLVVLTLKSASHLPAHAPSYDLVVRAELSGVTLLADPVTVTTSSFSSTTAQDLEEQQLVWEVSQSQLRQFRSRKILLRVELWINIEQAYGSKQGGFPFVFEWTMHMFSMPTIAA